MSTAEKYRYTSKRLQEEPSFDLQGLILLQEDYDRFNKQSSQSHKLQISPLLEELVHTQQNRNFLLALADYFDLWLHVGQELERIVAELDANPDDTEENDELEQLLKSKDVTLTEEKSKLLEKTEKAKSAAFVCRILHESSHPLEAYKRKWRRIHDLLRKRSPVNELKDAMIVLGRAYYAVVAWYSEKGLVAAQAQSLHGTRSDTRALKSAAANSLLGVRSFTDPSQALSREQAFWEPYYDTCERAVILHYPELVRLPLNVEMSRLFRSASFSEYARTKYFRQVALYRNKLRLERSLAAGDMKQSSSTNPSSGDTPVNNTKPTQQSKTGSLTPSGATKPTGNSENTTTSPLGSDGAGGGPAYDMISRFRTDLPSFTPTVSFSDARAIGAAAAAAAAVSSGSTVLNNLTVSGGGHRATSDSSSSVVTLQGPGASIATTAAAAAAAAGSSSVLANRNKPPISAGSICAIDLHVFLGDVVAPPTELWRQGIGVGGVVSSSAFGSDVKSMAGRRRRITNATAATRSPLISAILPSRLSRKEQYSSPLASISASNAYAHAAKLAATIQLGDKAGIENTTSGFAETKSDVLSSTIRSSSRQQRYQQTEAEIRQKQKSLDTFVSTLAQRMGSEWSQRNTNGEGKDGLKGTASSGEAETFEQLHERTALLLPPPHLRPKIGAHLDYPTQDTELSDPTGFR